MGGESKDAVVANDAAVLRNRSDFMLEEYRVIATAFHYMKDQRSKMIKHYLTLITLPLGLLAAVRTFGDFPTELTELPMIVGVFAFVIGLVGVLINAVLIQMRFQIINYARTINLVRQYFAKETEGPSIVKYLALPMTDDRPHYYEGRKSDDAPVNYAGVYFETLFIGVLNATLFILSFLVVVTPFLPSGFLGLYLVVYIVIGILTIWIQFFFYKRWADSRKESWIDERKEREKRVLLFDQTAQTTSNEGNSEEAGV